MAREIFRTMMEMVRESGKSRTADMYDEIVIKRTLDSKPFLLPESELKRILSKVEDGEERFKRYFDQDGSIDF